MKNLQGLQRLIAVIVFSLPALINVTSLLFLIYFIFSVLGCFIFKSITFLDSHG
ncbi:MAG: ion transporter [bacterium]